MTADDTVCHGMSPQELAGVMQELGFRAELDLENPKLPIVESYSEHWLFLVFMHKWKDADARYSNARLFSMNPDAKVQAITANQWNDNHRFGTFFVMDDGTPAIRMDFLLDMVTKGYIRHCFGVWEAVQRSFLVATGAHVPVATRQASISPPGGPSATRIVSPETANPSADISRSDLSAIERLLSRIADNTGEIVNRSPRSSPGQDFQAVINRLETANGILREIASNTRR